MRSQSEEVDAGVDGGGEEHEEAQLLPHPQPAVQPAGEGGVLGAPGERAEVTKESLNLH